MLRTAEEEPQGLASKIPRDSGLMGGRRMVRNAALMRPAVRCHAFQHMALYRGERQQSREERDDCRRRRRRSDLDEVN